MDRDIERTADQPEHRDPGDRERLRDKAPEWFKELERKRREGRDDADD